MSLSSSFSSLTSRSVYVHLPLSLTLFLSLFLCLSLSLSLSLSLCVLFFFSLSLSHSHSLYFSLSLSLYFIICLRSTSRRYSSYNGLCCCNRRGNSGRHTPCIGITSLPLAISSFLRSFMASSRRLCQRWIPNDRC